MVLLAGKDHAGKTFSVCAASASEHIGRTLLVSFGESDPEELGALPGARFEIVEHDGTYRGLVDTLKACVAEPDDGGPTLIALDSITKVWDLASEMAQQEANDRERRRGRSRNDEAKITSDLWNVAKQRFSHVVEVLSGHDGPTVLTARLDDVSIVDDQGQPTKDRQWKVKAEKNLPYEVDVVVQLRSRAEVVLAGAKSLRMSVDIRSEQEIPLPDFTLERLWHALGWLDGQLGTRRQVPVDAERSAQIAEHEAVQSAEKLAHQLSEAEEIASLRDALDHARRRHKWSWEQVSHDFEATRGMPPGEASLDERRRYVAELNSGPAGRAPREPQLEPQATTGGGLGDGAAAGVADGGGDVGGARGVGAGEGDPGPAVGGGDTGTGHGGSGDVAGGPEAGGDRSRAGGDGVAVGADGAGGGGRRRRPAAAREGDVA